ncbi:hypothetical protein F443_07184 [Phytophthora nicotianae P1569]|uniref:RxLR effector protein n=1 Tax=Phytophthora nicotianae P1569 TaxID=1317065 RepID=V9FEI8_PHYNI|nr:hypothetical protein F443_07184 [Phytophthora nicotianae P1569]
MRLHKMYIMLVAAAILGSTSFALANADMIGNIRKRGYPCESVETNRHLRQRDIEPANVLEERSSAEERGRFNAEAAAKAFAIDAKKIDDVVSKMEIEMVNMKYKPLKYLGLQNLRNFDGDSSQLVKLATQYFSGWKNSKYDATKIREEMAAAGITDETAIQNVQKWFDIFVKKVKDS